MDSVVAVIPTLGKNTQRLDASLASLRRFVSNSDIKIIIVNNSPTTQLGEVASEHLVVSPGLNLGYVGAIELVRRSFDHEYLWVIQDDMTLTNDVLPKLLERMNSDSTMAVTSPVLIRNGVVPARTRAGRFLNQEKTKWENLPLKDTPPEEQLYEGELSFVSGSGALYRAQALESVGGFNLDLYPLVHVDVDICARFLKDGWKIDLVPSAHISHEIQGSTPSLLSQTLDEINRATVTNYLAGKPQEWNVANIEIPPELLFKVARKASYLFLDLSIRHEAIVNNLNNLVYKRLVGALKPILSWTRGTVAKSLNHLRGFFNFGNRGK
jgi:GT2 family glycosyltransferase